MHFLDKLWITQKIVKKIKSFKGAFDLIKIIDNTLDGKEKRR